MLLATVKSGDYERASSILQEECADLDFNCQDYVCILLSMVGRTAVEYALH